jgi:hypothetical protein
MIFLVVALAGFAGAVAGVEYGRLFGLIGEIGFVVTGIAIFVTTPRT